MILYPISNRFKSGCFYFLLFLIFGSFNGIAQEKKLYEILTQQDDGGGSIRFYELLTESKEMEMLTNDPHLKNKIKPKDIDTANFVILNRGEKKGRGYLIGVQKIEESSSQITITIEDINPKKEILLEEEESYYPYTILKINSKKELIIK